MNRRKLLLSLVGAPIGLAAVAAASEKAKPAPKVTMKPNKVFAEIKKARTTHDHSTDALGFFVYDSRTGKILAENI